jgi:hypothetical protein
MSGERINEFMNLYLKRRLLYKNKSLKNINIVFGKFKFHFEIYFLLFIFYYFVFKL